MSVCLIRRGRDHSQHADVSQLEFLSVVATMRRMERADAIKQIQEACKQIALQFMKIHPAIRHLNDAETQSESLKSMHEMTVQLESIKKRLIRLEQRDDSADL